MPIPDLVTALPVPTKDAILNKIIDLVSDAAISNPEQKAIGKIIKLAQVSDPKVLELYYLLEGSLTAFARISSIILTNPDVVEFLKALAAEDIAAGQYAPTIEINELPKMARGIW